MSLCLLPTAPPAEQKRWTIASVDADRAEAARALAAELGCPEPIARLLICRGVVDARTFFSPTLDDLHAPGLLLGMDAAVRRIQRAVAEGEPILIYGDYDVDGTTATVLLKTAIERIAPADRPAQVSYHVPHRIHEGYGIQAARLAEAAAAGVRLVLSVDTGIRAFAAAEEARSLGLDLIVTDHHLPDGAAGLPDALAVINPAQPGCPYPNKQLCGAGVAFKLAHALLHAHADTPAAQAILRERLLPSFLKIVAIATVADSVELTGENRALVSLGLRSLANPVQPGLRALMQVAKLPPDRSPTAQEVAFRIAPRINAAGRMDVASDVVELLLTRDRERAAVLAEKLDRLNGERRAAEAEALDAIETQLQALREAADGELAPECIVLDDASWHRGVLGILASRVVERTGRPALVIAHETAGAEAVAHGSGRSVHGYHLVAALEHAHRPDTEQPALFSRFGGHAFAVGFSLPSASLPLLRERMRLHSAARLTPELLRPCLPCDLEIGFEELTPALLEWLERCEPFGNGNPEPVLVTRNLRVVAEPRRIKDIHICLELAAADSLPGCKLSALGWTRSGQTPWPERIAAMGITVQSAVDVVYRLRRNAHPIYGGLELELADLAPAAMPQ